MMRGSELVMVSTHAGLFGVYIAKVSGFYQHEEFAHD